MKVSKALVLIISIVFLTLKLFAHGGHDHDSPAKQKAPKGGIIKSLENTLVEVVSRDKDIKVYLYNKELKPKSVEGFKLTAIAEIPRTKKQEEVTLTAKETYYEMTYDAKNLHRYTLVLTIVDPSTGHNDKLKYTIEPKK